MADDYLAGEPTAPVLDLGFDSGMLGALRAGVKAHACQAGLPESRAEEVVLAVHELAANAVHHGRGAGRLRIWKRAGTLRCQVEDGDPVPSSGPVPMGFLLARLGHGLWVARQLADRMRVLSGAHGTRVTIIFDLPPGRPGQGCLQI